MKNKIKSSSSGSQTKPLAEHIWSVQKFEKIDWKKRTKILFASAVKEALKNIKEELRLKKDKNQNLNFNEVITIINKHSGEMK